MATIWIDGVWHTKESATVSVFDHGLLYMPLADCLTHNRAEYNACDESDILHIAE